MTVDMPEKPPTTKYVIPVLVIFGVTVTLSASFLFVLPLLAVQDLAYIDCASCDHDRTVALMHGLLGMIGFMLFGFLPLGIMLLTRRSRYNGPRNLNTKEG